MQRELPPNQPPPSLNRAAPRSGSSPRISLLPLSIGQPRAAGAPPKAASFLSQSGSPVQRELPPNQPPPSLNRAAPRSGSSPQSSLLPPSIGQPRAAGATPKTASFLSLSTTPAQRKLPQSSLLPLSIEQPRAVGAPPESASSLPQSGSPAQREQPPKQPPSSLYRPPPRSGSSPRISLLPPSIGQPRAAGAPPKAASFLSQSGSPVQRELPPNQPPPSLNRAAPRSGSSPRISLLPLSIGQPRAAGAPPKAASFLSQSGSPVQRELPPNQPPPSLNRAAPRSGSSPQSSLLPLSIGQPRAAGAPPESASSLPQSGSPAQREQPPKQPPSSLYRPPPRSGSSPQSSLLPLSIEQPRAAGAPPESASSLPQSGSPAQRELPPKQPPISLTRTAPCSESSPQSSLLLLPTSGSLLGMSLLANHTEPGRAG